MKLYIDKKLDYKYNDTVIETKENKRGTKMIEVAETLVGARTHTESNLKKNKKMIKIEDSFKNHAIMYDF